LRAITTYWEGIGSAAEQLAHGLAFVFAIDLHKEMASASRSV
jgi:hypothetical protein